MTLNQLSPQDSALIITLDGPSGSGKSTVSHKLARHFRVPCLDTGAMYRSLAFRALRQGFSLEDEPRLVALAKGLSFDFGYEGDRPWVRVKEAGHSEVEAGKEIRTPEVSLAASKVAKLKGVREVLVAQQREIGLRRGAVVEGRDAGTVIFSKAPYKFFLTASTAERARRRYLELKEKLGDSAPPLQEVQDEMVIRDRQDSERAESPLKPAADAEMIDTSSLDMEQVLQILIQKVESRRKA